MSSGDFERRRRAEKATSDNARTTERMDRDDKRTLILHMQLSRFRPCVQLAKFAKGSDDKKGKQAELEDPRACCAERPVAGLAHVSDQQESCSNVQ